MNSADVVGYAYNAALHCIECTRAAADVGLLTREPPLKLACDEHGIALDLVDSDGNPVHAVFCGEESHGEHCGDCGELLEGN